MRSWMIGCLLGTLCMAFSPVLLPLGWWPVAVMLVLVGPWRQRLACWGVLAAILLCSWRAETDLQHRWPEKCNNRPVTLQGHIASLPRVTPMDEDRRRQRFEFRVEQLSEQDCGLPRTVLLSYYGEKQLLPGERWVFAGKLRRPWGLSNPGSFNMQAWYALSGIDAVGSVRAGAGSRRLAVAERADALHHRLRLQVSQAIAETSLSAQASAVLSALTVADKSGLDHNMWSLFQWYGINHLLVISGLHVAMLAGLAFYLGGLVAALGAGLGWRCANWPWREILALLVAIAYTGLAGFSVATVRALVMLACFLGTRLFLRGNSAFNSLLLAAVLLALINPLVFVGAGFWLSFGAVLILLWLARWQKRGRVAQVLSAQVLMGLAMLPIGAWWFGGSSWVAPLANLVMIPLVGMYVVPMALAGALLQLLQADQLAMLCWRLASVPLDALWPVAQSLGRTAPLFLSVNSGLGTALLALSGILLAVLPLSLRWRLACMTSVLPLLLAGPSGPLQPQLHVLDVGQGTAVVYQAGVHTLLYDTGGGQPGGPNLAQTVVLPWLRYRGVERLQDLVISHNDLDHSAGLEDVKAALPVMNLWLGEWSGPAGMPCRAGISWRWPDGSRFRFLAPIGSEAGNDASCVLQITTGDIRILLPGDIGEAQERQLVRYWGRSLRSEVLLVGHHGSNTSTYQAWLNHVQPDVALVAAGYASRFGHPHSHVLARLGSSGARVLQTAQEGALSLRFGQDGAVSLTANRWGYQTWWM